MRPLLGTMPPGLRGKKENLGAFCVWWYKQVLRSGREVRWAYALHGATWRTSALVGNFKTRDAAIAAAHLDAEKHGEQRGRALAVIGITKMQDEAMKFATSLRDQAGDVERAASVIATITSIVRDVDRTDVTMEINASIWRDACQILRGVGIATPEWSSLLRESEEP